MKLVLRSFREKYTTDADNLQLALKASSAAIDRKLQSAQSQRALSYDFSKPVYMDAILKTFAICAEHFKSSLGNTLVVKRMQKAKENVASLFPIVNDLIVDQNGRIYPRKGRPLDLDATSNEAFARWLAGFINMASTAEPGTQPMDVRGMTKSVAQPLEDSNFYGMLAAVYG